MARHGLFLVPAFLALTFCSCATSGADSGSDPDGGSGATAGSGGSGGSNSGGSGSASGSGASSGAGGVGSDVCFLHDCASDAECVSCPNGKTKCDVASKRCMTCLATDPPGACGPGKECSQYGTCIPVGMSCPLDGSGEPTITCSTDNDCYACDPMHQVCDTATQKCVTCSATNKYACQPVELCKNGACSLKCPAQCGSDADCTECGSLVHPGNACNPNTKHCGECSDTHPCTGNTVCGPQGMCIKVCGAMGKAKGSCGSDADCAGCDGDATACHVPVNGGAGKCGIAASGCSDIGSFTALPEPWSSVTNSCSSDDDCKGVGIDLNIGKVLRDLTGLDQIGDATMQYGMNVCAAVTVGVLGKSYSCGMCVPCKEDSDCEPIKFDPLLAQAFGPMGSVIAKAMIKEVWGDAPHELQMYCEPVLGEFGVCAPCFDFMHTCAVSSTEGSGCTSDWDCAAGERCDTATGQCAAYLTSCFGGTDCTGGQVCAWNGDGYCCRAPGDSVKSCFSDAECSPQICAYNGAGYYCTAPVACQ